MFDLPKLRPIGQAPISWGLHPLKGPGWIAVSRIELEGLGQGQDLVAVVQVGLPQAVVHIPRARIGLDVETLTGIPAATLLISYSVIVHYITLVKIIFWGSVVLSFLVPAKLL